jgi:hypothetical protein
VLFLSLYEDKNENFKLMKNGKLLLTKVQFKFFYQIIGVRLYKNKHMNQLHIHGLYNLFYC